MPTSTRPGPEKGLRSPALGRPRSGLTSRIHLACDGTGRPLTFVLTGGNTNDCTQFTAAMDAVRAPRIGPGRPRIWPDHVIGDKGYSSWRRAKEKASQMPFCSKRTRSAGHGWMVIWVRCIRLWCGGRRKSSEWWALTLASRPVAALPLA
ncbi:transposase [Streptomyces xanthophaeus]|uniref:transposase n=1 Tax=Streptomyces xanthophaeus TaxID=67385 RepID=UPI0036BDF6E4